MSLFMRIAFGVLFFLSAPRLPSFLSGFFPTCGVNQDGNQFCLFQDGSFEYTNRDGSRERIQADGSYEYEHSDGSYWVLRGDGREEFSPRLGWW